MRQVFGANGWWGWCVVSAHCRVLEGVRPRKWLSELLKPRAFVRSERALEGYTWDVMGSLLEFAGAEAGGTPIVLVQQYGLFNLGSD